VVAECNRLNDKAGMIEAWARGTVKIVDKCTKSKIGFVAKERRAGYAAMKKSSR